MYKSFWPQFSSIPSHILHCDCCRNANKEVNQEVNQIFVFAFPSLFLLHSFFFQSRTQKKLASSVSLSRSALPAHEAHCAQMTEWTNATGSGAEPLFFFPTLFTFMKNCHSGYRHCTAACTLFTGGAVHAESECDEKISLLAFAETSILSAAGWKHFSYRRDSVELGSDSTFCTFAPCCSTHTHTHTGRATMSSLSRRKNK